MSTGPPFKENDSPTHTWRSWREDTSKLNYPDRDIRIIFPEEDGVSGLEYSPAVFGDFDPQPDDPDPEVWPLEHFDPGYPAPTSDLIMIANTYPAPSVAWVTEEYLEARYGYNPCSVEVTAEELPPGSRPPNTEADEPVKLGGSNSGTSSMPLTGDRIEALNRIADLWNGKTVRGHHLLLDKCPDWQHVLSDLDQTELRRLVVDPDVNQEFAEQFSEHDWYENEQNVYVKPQRILRQKVWYSPTQKGRTLINRHGQLSDLKGDPNERLRHRFTVGLTALLEKIRNRDVKTYYSLDGYIVDVVSRDTDGKIYAIEIVTGHNNWKEHRRTYLKLKQLESKGAIAQVAFDSRSTAYDVINHWHRSGLARLPNGPFNSDPNIEHGRSIIQDAYDDDPGWAINDWQTTQTLWRETLGPEGPKIRSGAVTSLDW